MFLPSFVYSQQRWRDAVHDMEALLSRQRQMYSIHADEACKIVRDNEFITLVHARESRLNQTALMRSLVRHLRSALLVVLQLKRFTELDTVR